MLGQSTLVLPSSKNLLISCLDSTFPNLLAQPRVPNLSFITLLSYVADLRSVGLWLELGSSIFDCQTLYHLVCLLVRVQHTLDLSMHNYPIP
jgi:hypothetical protein